MTRNLPPRKGVTAWGIEPMEENGDEFFVLTFHHGLGEMTRLDLWAEEVQDVAQMLTEAARAAQIQSLKDQVQRRLARDLHIIDDEIARCSTLAEADAHRLGIELYSKLRRISDEAKDLPDSSGKKMLTDRYAAAVQTLKVEVFGIQ